MLELALTLSIITMVLYAVTILVYIHQYKRKLKEYQALEQVNEDLLIEKYELKQRLGEGWE